MAVSALAPSAPPLAGNDNLDPAALAAKNAPIQKKITDKVDDTDAALKGIETTREAQFGALESQRDKLQIPKLQQVPQPTAKSTDPMHIWGSAAMTMVLLGSLMTRQPLTTALNAATGVMKAYHEGDQAKANAAYQTWKVASDNAMKLYDYQNKVYEKILGDLDRREHEVDTEATHKETNVLAELRANAYALNDNMMANVKTTTEAIRMQTARATAQRQLETQSLRLEQTHASMAAIAEEKAKPEWQTMSKEAQAMKIRQLTKETAPQDYAEAKKKIQDMSNAYIKQAQAIRDTWAHNLANYKTHHAGMIPLGDKEGKRLELGLNAADMALVKFRGQYTKHLEDIPLSDEAMAATEPQPKVYANPEAVIEDYNKLHISREQALEALKENGWGD